MNCLWMLGWMGILFAILMIITFGFAYDSVQSNTICLAWQKAFGIEPATMGIVLTALTLLFDTDKLVVLCHTVGTAHRTGLNLTRVCSNSNISDCCILCFTRTV
jgi:chromate transport protein ChrA